jgi:hypothetical protein
MLTGRGLESIAANRFGSNQFALSLSIDSPLRCYRNIPPIPCSADTMSLLSSPIKKSVLILLPLVNPPLRLLKDKKYDDRHIYI